MRKTITLLILTLVLTFTLLQGKASADTVLRWSGKKAHHWSTSNSWLRGSDYIPESAVNQLKMWQ
jgi:hypothetical protein